jgi:hypothetical protein
MSKRRTVTFRNESFNTRTSRSYFINAGCFGDDVLEWLASALTASGVKVIGKPDQEDFGWFLNFECREVNHCFVLGYRPDEPRGLWVGSLERSRNVLGSMLGLRRVGIRQDAALLIHRLLSGMPGTTEILWHEDSDFRQGIENRGVPAMSPLSDERVRRLPSQLQGALTRRPGRSSSGR